MSLFSTQRQRDMQAQFDALNRAQAVIEFALDGTILNANENFLQAVGYSLAEIRGKHHSLFIEPAERDSAAYRAFWAKLGRGDHDAGQYRRQAKGGREIWIQASYNPVFDRHGRPRKVVKFATDITVQKARDADLQGQLAAIGKAQAVIEFKLDGTILTANENFLQVLGYRLEDIAGKHHSLFVDTAERDSAGYRAFWAKLERGDYDAGQYRRLAKGGRDVWIQASYNPIMDAAGRPYKVVKFATDVTAQVQATQEMEAAVRDVETVVRAARAHDLTGTISLSGKTGSLRSLCQGVNDLVGTMKDIVQQLRETSGTIAAAASEISASSQELEQRTASQAANIEQTAASSQEITSTVQQNAASAQAANRLAATARDKAEKGGGVVREAVQAVSDIERSAQKIGDIVGLIDEIAFQTNLLALNASVEAARAGEAGKGFAVVAQEVRALAQRSASASKDIKGLIQESNSQVRSGAALVNDTGAALGEIVEAIKQVSDIVAEIAAASQEQATGLDQISSAIGDLERITQQNGTMVEETSASARQLAGRAEELSQLVQGYRIS